jgi:hypothetical protein
MLFFARATRFKPFVSLIPTKILPASLVVIIAALSISAQTPAPAQNPDLVTYQALRNLGLSGEAVSVSNLALKRDAGTFHLRSGTVCFVAPVNGKVTGAVFTGDGSFVLDPPSQQEKNSLKLLTKENEF